LPSGPVWHVRRRITFTDKAVASMTHVSPLGDAKRDLDSIVYGIHACAGTDGDWSEVLSLLRDRLDGRLATLSRHHFASGRGSVVCEHPRNPQYRTEYGEYAPRNPWFLSSDEYTAGRVFTGDELLSNRELVKTDFYRGFLEPHKLFHYLSGVAVRRGPLVYYVTVHRGQDQAEFGEPEKSDLRSILAHLSLALENRWRVRQACDLAGVLMSVVDRDPHPSLLVDADGQVIHCNRSADARTAVSPGLCIEDGRIVAATHVDRAALREAIRNVAQAPSDGDDRTRAITLSVPGSVHPVVVSIYAAGAVFDAQTGETAQLALVTARSPGHGHDGHTCSFVRHFGLSPAQARVSTMIVSGHSLSDTARRLHVSENTVRSHLKQIFQKTNTHGQMELVHLHARTCIESD
jgi:DNA-binding CsgD family transcriptional regulator/PAS domain-containing protein